MNCYLLVQRMALYFNKNPQTRFKGILDISVYDACFVNSRERPRHLQYEYKAEGKNNIVYNFTKLSTQKGTFEQSHKQASEMTFFSFHFTKGYRGAFLSNQFWCHSLPHGYSGGSSQWLMIFFTDRPAHLVSKEPFHRAVKTLRGMDALIKSQMVTHTLNS